MPGDESKSKQRKRAAGRKAAQKCREAADAIQAYISACNAADDSSGVSRADDQRLLFVRDLRDYQAFLEMRHG